MTSWRDFAVSSSGRWKNERGLVTRLRLADGASRHLRCAGVGSQPQRNCRPTGGTDTCIDSWPRACRQPAVTGRAGHGARIEGRHWPPSRPSAASTPTARGGRHLEHRALPRTTWLWVRPRPAHEANRTPRRPAFVHPGCAVTSIPRAMIDLDDPQVRQLDRLVCKSRRYRPAPARAGTGAPQPQETPSPTRPKWRSGPPCGRTLRFQCSRQQPVTHHRPSHSTRIQPIPWQLFCFVGPHGRWSAATTLCQPYLVARPATGDAGRRQHQPKQARMPLPARTAHLVGAPWLEGVGEEWRLRILYPTPRAAALVAGSEGMQRLAGAWHASRTSGPTASSCASGEQERPAVPGKRGAGNHSGGAAHPSPRTGRARRKRTGSRHPPSLPANWISRSIWLRHTRWTRPIACRCNCLAWHDGGNVVAYSVEWCSNEFDTVGGSGVYCVYSINTRPVLHREPSAEQKRIDY